mmetsp:Transcript_19453/g.49300  ORF Transcript_19453/g.49300 Transcript_19453/m.49300 type:complete len:308 (+) Transcript_19453:1768-2691(+)
MGRDVVKIELTLMIATVHAIPNSTCCTATSACNCHQVTLRLRAGYSRKKETNMIPASTMPIQRGMVTLSVSHSASPQLSSHPSFTPSVVTDENASRPNTREIQKYSNVDPRSVMIVVCWNLDSLSASLKHPRRGETGPSLRSVHFCECSTGIASWLISIEPSCEKLSNDDFLASKVLSTANLKCSSSLPAESFAPESVVPHNPKQPASLLLCLGIGASCLSWSITRMRTSPLWGFPLHALRSATPSSAMKRCVLTMPLPLSCTSSTVLRVGTTSPKVSCMCTEHLTCPQVDAWHNLAAVTTVSPNSR